MTTEPEPCQTNAPGPFLTIGDASVFTLGGDRFRITWPDGEREVEGFERAEELVDELAG